MMSAGNPVSTHELDHFSMTVRRLAMGVAMGGLFGLSLGSANANGIGVADAPLEATFYSDTSCLITINSFVQSGTTFIDADVDTDGSRMFIHCDTEDGKRLTLLARGDSLQTEERAPLLNRTQIADGEYGMLAWLTRPGVLYTDDSAPRRYVIGGNVKLRKSPAINAVANALNSNAHSFASINGILEPIVKSEAQSMQLTPIDELPTEEASPGNSTKHNSVKTPVAESNGQTTENVVR